MACSGLEGVGGERWAHVSGICMLLVFAILRPSSVNLRRPTEQAESERGRGCMCACASRARISYVYVMRRRSWTVRCVVDILRFVSWWDGVALRLFLASCDFDVDVDTRS